MLPTLSPDDGLVHAPSLLVPVQISRPAVAVVTLPLFLNIKQADVTVSAPQLMCC